MGKGLAQLIAEKQDTILTSWFEAAVQSYAAETSQFLMSRKDQFANPVGSATRQGLAGLLGQLLADMDQQQAAGHLDPIMRIRAVQDFTPSQAIAFIPALKHILRRTFAGELKDPEMKDQLVEYEDRIDRLCLTAVDLYVACKEKVYQLKANETRNRVFSAFERAGLVSRDAAS
jgi:hypothetical protein